MNFNCKWIKLKVSPVQISSVKAKESGTFTYRIDPQVITQKLCPPVCAPQGHWDHELYALGSVCLLTERWAVCKSSPRLGGEMGYSQGRPPTPTPPFVPIDQPAQDVHRGGGDNVQLLTNICLVNSFIGSHLSSACIPIEFSIRNKNGNVFIRQAQPERTPNPDDCWCVSAFWIILSVYNTCSLTHS